VLSNSARLPVGDSMADGAVASEIQRKKAGHVKRQNELWSRLVKVRIHLQQVLSNSARLPVGGSMAEFLELDGRSQRESELIKGSGLKQLTPLQSVLTQTQKTAAKFLVQLSSLQAALVGRSPLLEGRVPKLGLEGVTSIASVNNPGLKGVPSRKKRQREETNLLPPEEAAWKSVDLLPRAIHPWCIEVLDQWKAATTLKGKGSLKAMDQSIGSQMKHAMEGLGRLVQKCTPTIESVRAFGHFEMRPPPVSGGLGDVGSFVRLNDEVFDDKEFYVQLLKDMVLSSSTSEGQDSFLQSEMLLVGNKRARRTESNQKRRTVERRASKGRKIRYVPIPKLVNFMTPVPPSMVSLSRFGDSALVDKMIKSIFVED